MKYGPFMNMRFMSSIASNTNTKKPLSMKWLLIPSLTKGHQFLCTQASTALGEGHKPVNCPISPHSARFNAALQGSSIDRATVGMDSMFFTNFCWFYVAGRLLLAATRSWNAASSSGKGGSFLGSPPGAMALKLCVVSWLAVALRALPGLPHRPRRLHQAPVI